LGKGGKKRALRFRARVSDAGEYTFEATAHPGYFLTVDKDEATGENDIFLAKVLGTSFQDFRHRFTLFASQEDLQIIIHEFAPVEPVCTGPICDSRILHTERVELTRFQAAQTNRPGYFEQLLQIDHLTEVPILTRFQTS